MEEVIDDIISMQSSYDDVQGYMDPVQMPNTVSRENPPSKKKRISSFSQCFLCRLYFA